MGFLEYLKRRVSTTHRLQCWHRAYLLVVCCICTFGHLGHEGNTLNAALPSHSPVHGCMGSPAACRPVRCSRPPWRNPALCIGAFSWSPALIFEPPSVREGIIRRCSYRLASGLAVLVFTCPVITSQLRTRFQHRCTQPPVQQLVMPRSSLRLRRLQIVGHAPPVLGHARGDAPSKL